MDETPAGAPPPEVRPPHPERKRRPGSFVLKLTLSQALRMLKIFVVVDILAALLWGGLLLTELEADAALLAGAWPDTTGLRAGVEAEEQPRSAGGIYLHTQVEKRLPLPTGSVRGFQVLPGEPFFWRLAGRPQYVLSVPLGAEGYLHIRYELAGYLGRFCRGMSVLLLVELVLWWGNVRAARRSFRRTLAPISQLAAATQSISAESAAQGVGKGVGQRRTRAERAADKAGREKHGGKKTEPQKVELSGTIDTLNKITAKRLDTRIPIENERAELRGLASAINSMLDRLDAAYSSQLRFVSDASHELRTPIAVLQGYANLLDRWGKDDPAVLQESIDAIKAESEGMQALVEQLLFLARSDNNSIVMREEPLELSALAAEVLRETGMTAPRHQLVADIDPGLWAEGDQGLLKQALRIFVDNAVKYTPPGERITISAKRGEDGVRVSVTDNGIGIPEADLPHVFERFYRSDESRARTTGGTGLGLSIAHWIIQRHGGHLEILSRQDVGTRLTMVLPAAEDPARTGEGDGESSA